MKKKLVWVIVTLVIVLGAIYGAGVVYFSNHFTMGANIMNTSVAFDDNAKAQSLVESKIKSSQVSVKLPSDQLSVSYDKAGLIVNAKEIVSKALQSQNKFLWFVPQSVKIDNSFGKTLNTSNIELAYGKDIKSSLPKQNLKKLIKYNSSTDKFEVKASTNKEAYIYSDILMSIKNAILNNESNITIKPTSNIEKSLSGVIDKINVMSSKDIPIRFGDKDDSIDQKYVHRLIKITNDGVQVNNDKLVSTINVIAGTHEGMHDGTLYTYNVSSLISKIKNDMEHYKVGSYDAKETAIKTTANTGSGTVHLKGSYLEANISAQKVYAWLNGKLVKTFDVVTGDHSKGRDTTLGVWSIWNKETNKILRGSTVGSGADYNYEIPVKYWMPIDDTGIGLHSIDPDEVTGSHGRVYWGKDAYLTGRGSHGCVNMHTADAGWIFNTYPINTKVYVTP